MHTFGTACVHIFMDLHVRMILLTCGRAHDLLTCGRAHYCLDLCVRIIFWTCGYAYFGGMHVRTLLGSARAHELWGQKHTQVRAYPEHVFSAWTQFAQNFVNLWKFSREQSIWQCLPTASYVDPPFTPLTTHTHLMTIPDHAAYPCPIL